MKFFCVGLFSSLLLIPAASAVAQDKQPLQGNWLGRGCGKDIAVAMSYLINGDKTILEGMVLTPGRATLNLNSIAPASYRISNGQTTVSSKNGAFAFDLRLAPDKTLSGTVKNSAGQSLSVQFERGPDGDLTKYANAYAHFCKFH
jgi:hypothetical protein